MKTPGPDHPITLTPNPHRVRIRYDNHVLGDTRRAITLQEANLSPVQYVPREDFESAWLSRTDKVTHCPYKGDASYYSLFVNGDLSENVVWSYENPYPAMEAIRGHLAFYTDKIDVYEVEDEIEQRSMGDRTVNEAVEGGANDRAG